jgi:hypothetical protein
MSNKTLVHLPTMQSLRVYASIAIEKVEIKSQGTNTRMRTWSHDIQINRGPPTHPAKLPQKYLRTTKPTNFPKTRRNHDANITFRYYFLSTIGGLMGPTNIYGNDPKWRSLRPILERRQIGSHGRLDHRGQGWTRWQRWETTIQPKLQRYNLAPHIYAAIYLLLLIRMEFL